MTWSDSRPKMLVAQAREFASNGDHAGAVLLLESALVLLGEALALYPDDPNVLAARERALFYLGVTLLDLGQNEAAERSLRAAANLKGKSEFYAWGELGLLLGDRDAFEEAAFCFEQCVRISPSVAVLTLLSRMQLEFDPEGSVANAERALSLDPAWDEAQTTRDAAKKEIRRRGAE